MKSLDFFFTIEDRKFKNYFLEDFPIDYFFSVVYQNIFLPELFQFHRDSSCQDLQSVIMRKWVYLDKSPIYNSWEYWSTQLFSIRLKASRVCCHTSMVQSLRQKKDHHVYNISLDYIVISRLAWTHNKTLFQNKI